jgi:hypothetical protein
MSTINNQQPVNPALADFYARQAEQERRHNEMLEGIRAKYAAAAAEWPGECRAKRNPAVLITLAGLTDGIASAYGESIP